MHRFYVIFLLLLIPAVLLPASESYRTQTTSPRVRTLRIRTVDAQTLLPPVGDPTRPYLVMDNGQPITENGDSQGMVLEISFDEMSHDIHQYSFTLTHADRFWQQDRLSSNEYVGGFTNKDITDYEPSLNTQQLYTHYRFTLPNEDMSLRASGNYVVTIYEDGDPEKVIATQCFHVLDQQVILSANVTPNTDIELSGHYQQLEVDLRQTRGNTPANDYSLYVEQNGHTDNAVVDIPPTMIAERHLQWQHCRDLIFEAGNEYRHFDTYSTYMAGDGVDRIVYGEGDYHAILMSDAIADGTYIHRYDAHGQYLINAERTQDDDVEAEYMWVHFFLPRTEPWFDGAVYVGGDLFGNKTSLENRMQYDNDLRGYYLTALLKQGGYDYQYWFVEKGKKKTTPRRTEGSFWQTRNEYTLMVYYHPFGARYDQLVGLIRVP